MALCDVAALDVLVLAAVGGALEEPVLVGALLMLPVEGVAAAELQGVVVAEREGAAAALVETVLETVLAAVVVGVEPCVCGSQTKVGRDAPLSALIADKTPLEEEAPP